MHSDGAFVDRRVRQALRKGCLKGVSPVLIVGLSLSLLVVHHVCGWV